MSNAVKNIYYSVGVFVFIVAAFFVITYATGYKIDIASRNFSQTSMIVVQTDNANIKINNDFVGSNKVVIRDLEPGSYKVEIYKEGYYNWVKTIDILPGQAGIIDDDILFKANVTPQEYKVTGTDFFSQLSDTQGLSSANNEIYQNSNFVTRFANEVKGVCWYSDRRYIAYTYDKYLKIIGIDGTNEVTIIPKNSDSQVVFINSGRSVIYENEGKVYKADIR